MISEEEIECDDNMLLFDDIKKFALASFYNWKKKNEK